MHEPGADRLDQVYVDFAGVGPHRPGLAAADQLASNTRAALGPVAVTQHMLSNHVVSVDGDRARVEFYEQALHHHPALGDDPEVNTWFLYARASRNANRYVSQSRESAAVKIRLTRSMSSWASAELVIICFLSHRVAEVARAHSVGVSSHRWTLLTVG